LLNNQESKMFFDFLKSKGGKQNAIEVAVFRQVQSEARINIRDA